MKRVIIAVSLICLISLESKQVSIVILDSKSTKPAGYVKVKHRNTLLKTTQENGVAKLDLDSLILEGIDSISFESFWHHKTFVEIQQLKKDSIVKLKPKKTKVIVYNNSEKSLQVPVLIRLTKSDEDINNGNVVISEKELKENLKRLFNGYWYLIMHQYSKSIRSFYCENILLLFGDKVLVYFEPKDSVGAIKSIKFYKSIPDYYCDGFNVLVYKSNEMFKIPQTKLLDEFAIEKKDYFEYELKDKIYFYKSVFIGYNDYGSNYYSDNPNKKLQKNDKHYLPCIKYQKTMNNLNTFMRFDNKWEQIENIDGFYISPIIEMKVIVPEN